jgi:hypothetical protein
MKDDKVCLVKGCNNKYYSKGYCSRHYKQFYRVGHIISMKKMNISLKNIKCCVCKNNAYARIKNKPYCKKHYNQIWRCGHILKITIFTPNKIIIRKNYAEIILRNKYNDEIDRVKIDLCDIDNIKKYKWSIDKISKSKLKYAKTFLRIKDKSYNMHLHRLILNNFKINKKLFFNRKFVIDHKNRNGLDNRRKNLRICSASLNSFNRKMQNNNKTGHRGLWFDKSSNKWLAAIGVNNKRITLGRFLNKKEAIKIRKKAELKYFGETNNEN